VSTAQPQARTENSSKPVKRSYKDQRELDSLPARIESLEAEQTALQQAINDPGFYRQTQHEVSATLSRLDAVIAELEQCYARWALLEGA
jgi:ATP-binding cassette subfamily F protein uup